MSVKDIEFNDIAFFEKDGIKAVILYGKDKEKAKNLHKAISDKGFYFKSKSEQNGCYTVGLDVISYGQTLILETGYTRKTLPQVVWLDNSSFSDIIIAYREEGNTEFLNPSFSMNSWINPN